MPAWVTPMQQLRKPSAKRTQFAARLDRAATAPDAMCRAITFKTSQCLRLTRRRPNPELLRFGKARSNLALTASQSHLVERNHHDEARPSLPRSHQVAAATAAVQLRAVSHPGTAQLAPRNEEQGRLARDDGGPAPVPLPHLRLPAAQPGEGLQARPAVLQRA